MMTDRIPPSFHSEAACMSRRAKILLAFLLVPITCVGVWWFRLPYIDSELFGVWHIELPGRRGEIGLPIITLWANGDWRDHSGEFGLNSQPTLSWAVSGNEVCLTAGDPIWPTSGSASHRLHVLSRRISDACQGKRPLFNETLKRFRQQVDEDGVVWLVEVPEFSGQKPDRLRRNM